MTKIIGLTGGIGSGKTMVANLFLKYGIPTYFADEGARKILYQPETTALIARTFGDAVMDGDIVDRQKLGAIVFNDPQKLEQLNGIIHPAVRKDFMEWVENHSDRPLVIKEAAILFESGTHTDCDAIITVTAPVETRIERVMKRDQISRDEVLQRVENQWDDKKKAALSDFVIENIEPADTERQIKEILKKLQKI